MGLKSEKCGRRWDRFPLFPSVLRHHEAASAALNRSSGHKVLFPIPTTQLSSPSFILWL